MTLSPALLAAIAFAVVLHYFAGPAWRTLALVRAEVLRLRLEHKLGGAIVPVVGEIHRHHADRFLRRLARVRATQKLYILLDTLGGDAPESEAMARAIARHPHTVIAVVPRIAWSGGTHVASAADTILMAPEANLGPCCPIGHIDSTALLSAVQIRAADTATPHDLVRARDMHKHLFEAIRKTRLARGDAPAVAEDFSERLVNGSWGSHWRPIFREDAVDMGFHVRPLEDCTEAAGLAKLARLYNVVAGE